MNQEELLAFLAGLGFEGPALTTGIAVMLERFPQIATVHHLIRYGEEQMHFALNFEHDRQFNAYRLASYKATYRRPVSIDYDVYRGVGIAGLEESMQMVDWNNWFSVREQSHEATIAESVHQLLDQIASAGDVQGIELRDLLRYKYFPAEALDMRVRRNMAIEYEREQTFYATAVGIATANLAFHILNGNLERIHHEVSKVDLEEFIPFDLHALLCMQMSRGVNEFNIECAQMMKEGTVLFNIPVSLAGNKYEAGVNTVTFEPAETIIHKKIGHVDTKALEDQMAAIDWHSSDLQLSADNVRLSAQVEQVDRMLSFLEQTTSGKQIAGQLKRRYWSAVPFFEAFVPAKDANTDKITAEFPLDVQARSIYNLFCGRAVIAGSLRTLQAAYNEWLRMSGVDGNKPQFITIKDSLSRPDLDHLITILCVQEPQHQIVNALLQGDRVKVSALTLEGYRNLQLEAIPEQRDLKVLNETGVTIPTNFRLQTEVELKSSQGKNIATGKQKKHGKML